MPIAQTSAAELYAWLRTRAILTVATTPNDVNGAPPQLYTEFDFKRPCAILMGEEKYGLSPFWIENANAAVKIPMRGRINSLNVATSAALVVYEALKQRQSPAPSSSTR
jgi:RNA methyltransferase, TrmH family